MIRGLFAPQRRIVYYVFFIGHDQQKRRLEIGNVYGIVATLERLHDARYRGIVLMVMSVFFAQIEKSGPEVEQVVRQIVFHQLSAMH